MSACRLHQCPVLTLWNGWWKRPHTGGSAPRTRLLVVCAACLCADCLQNAWWRSGNVEATVAVALQNRSTSSPGAGALGVDN